MENLIFCAVKFAVKCERINALVFQDEEKAKKWICKICKTVLLILLKMFRALNE